MDKIPARYFGLPETLARKMEYYEEHYCTFDLPIPLECGLQLYPVLVKDYVDFMSCVSCLMVDKNETREGIKMSNLQFMWNLMTQNNNPEHDREAAGWWYRFSKLLEIVFRLPSGVICTKCQKVFTLSEYQAKGRILQDQISEHPEILDREVRCDCGDPDSVLVPIIGFKVDPKSIVQGHPEKSRHILVINGRYEIGTKAFDEIRKIILYQNLTDYRDESNVDPTLRKQEAERRRLEALKNGDISASLEKKMVCLSSQTSYSFKDIQELSIRKFNMLLFTVDDAMNYKIMRTAQMSGFVQMKNAPEHWIYKAAEKDIYGHYQSVDEAQKSLVDLNSNK